MDCVPFFASPPMVTVLTLPARFVNVRATEASADWTATVSLPSLVSTAIEVTERSGPVTVVVPLPVQPAAIAPAWRVIVVAGVVKSVKVYFPVGPDVRIVRLSATPGVDRKLRAPPAMLSVASRVRASSGSQSRRRRPGRDLLGRAVPIASRVAWSRNRKRCVMTRTPGSMSGLLKTSKDETERSIERLPGDPGGDPGMQPAAFHPAERGRRPSAIMWGSPGAIRVAAGPRAPRPSGTPTRDRRCP